jgi:iron complex transport system substrate-binding protein
MNRIALVFAAALASLFAGATAAAAYPVSVVSCFDTVSFAGAPRRPVANSPNMIQTVIDLGLIDRFVGVSNTQETLDKLAAPPAVIARIKAKVISPVGATAEQLLGLNADFYYAGWRYGFVESTGVNPRALEKLGIKSYALAESCTRIGKKTPLSMDVVYADTLALGRIFGVETRAQMLVEEQKRRVKAVTDRTAKAARRPRVMYCGGCYTEEPPLSIGATGMPSLLASLAGGRNIFDDIKDSYVPVSWEAVIARDPEWIIVSDDKIPATTRIAFMTANPLLRNVTAIKKRQFVTLTYVERSPSTRNVAGLERLAKAMHPELFAASN